jgi:hypothetical protein
MNRHYSQVALRDIVEAIEFKAVVELDRLARRLHPT